MDADDKAGLIQFLVELKLSKKRDILQVSPADEDRWLLVEMRSSSFNSQPMDETSPAAEMPPLGSATTARTVAMARGTRTQTRA